MLVVASLFIMFLGLAGTALPVLPGLPLVYLGYFFYGFFTSWQSFGAVTMIIWGFVVVIVLLLDYLAGMVGARRSGASAFGIWGSVVGAVAGVMLFGLVGLVAGTFLGAVLGELVAGRPPGEALRSGKGAFMGFIAGSIFKVVVGFIMIGTFLWQIL